MDGIAPSAAVSFVVRVVTPMAAIAPASMMMCMFDFFIVIGVSAFGNFLLRDVNTPRLAETLKLFSITFESSTLSVSPKQTSGLED